MLIGILGEAGSGKDTAGRFMVQERGFYSLALADPIKVYCHWMFNWDAEQFWGASSKRNEKDPRYPFYRCPVCGFAHRSSNTQCTACSTRYVLGYEWKATLSPRYALQSLGDWARALFKDAYIEFTLRRVKAVQQYGISFDPLWDTLQHLGVKDRWVDDDMLNEPVSNVLISDVRLKNEIEGIQKEGGKVYRIRRQGTYDNTTSGIPKHNSEVEQREVVDSDLDGVISNNDTPQHMYAQLSELLKRFL